MLPTHISIKCVLATPMTRIDYNKYRGWTLPADENGSDEGYLIQSRNHVSWVPKAVFDEDYRENNGMTFGTALDLLKRGHRVARIGWNGKGQWLSYVSQGSYDVGCGAIGFDPNKKDSVPPTLRPWIGIKTVGEEFMPWTPSQSDQLADDWTIVHEPS